MAICSDCVRLIGLAMKLALSSFPIASTGDPDEAQSILSRELSELRFKSVQNRRDFRLNMNGVHLGRTLVAFNRFATETQVDAGVIGHAVIVSFCVGPPSFVTLDKQAIGPESGAVTSPTRRLNVHRSPGSGVFLMRVSCDTIRQRIGELTGLIPKEPLVFERCVPLTSEPGAQVRRVLTSIVRDVENDATLLDNRLLRTGFDELILNAILTLPNNYSTSIQCDRQLDVGHKLVRQAEEFLETHATAPITISDMVAEFGCSRSALFKAFRRYRGYTPMQFLMESRLRSARHALANATPADSVASIARACGFSHLGRFSFAYRKHFGETPSQTMRKA